jgi:N-carbamoyl-L-amino-acid hydrolase
MVTGTVGVERHAVTFHGDALHAGSTPMDARHDAFAGAARFALKVRSEAIQAGAMATTGRCVTEPGIPTATAATAQLYVDQRHSDGDLLASLVARAVAVSRAIAEEEGLTVDWTPLWRIDPVAFDERLIELGSEVIADLAGASPRLPSGALHDAAEVARAAVPTGMLFVRSINGISHNSAEDSDEADLILSARALADWIDRALSELAGGR